MSRRVLIHYAHPTPHRSRVNRHLIAAAEALPGVTVRHLYELYPDFLIDVAQEQALLLDHDVIVLQHPLFWYSAPAIVKEWLDLVLQYGWAYGEGGTALQGKLLLQAITTGGGEEIYCATGKHRHTVREFLLPFEQSALLCGMTYLPPFVIHAAGQLQNEAALAPHLTDYLRCITALRDDTLDVSRILTQPRLNLPARPDE